jgi:hypothetical protein
MARARKFSKRIEIWQTTKVPDGFGGNKIVEKLITSSWAQIVTFSATSSHLRNLNAFGVNDTQNAILITFRKRNDITYNSINQFVIYRGLKYIISTNPNNEQFEDSFITFIGVRQATESVSEIAPIGGEFFDYTFDFILTSKEETVNAIVDKYTSRVELSGGAINSAECLHSYVNKIVN